MAKPAKREEIFLDTLRSLEKSEAEFLNETFNVMERYIGHEPEVVSRLESILRNARDIKQVIQKVGQNMAPSEAVPTALQTEIRPLLSGRRILADQMEFLLAHFPRNSPLHERVEAPD